MSESVYSFCNRMRDEDVMRCEMKHIATENQNNNKVRKHAPTSPMCVEIILL